MKRIYRLRVETTCFDKCNKDHTIEYERDRHTGDILTEQHVGYFDTIEEAKGMMLLLERNMTDKGFEKEYFHSSANDLMHIVRYMELDAKGRVTKAGTGFESILTISTIQLGSMLY